MINQQQRGQGLIGLVMRFNVDLMNQGPWMRLGSSNLRDYIYALRGLASRRDPVSNALVTDYAKDPADVFTEFTRLLFGGAHDAAPQGFPIVDTLLFSQMESKTIPGLPTWVPDWSANITLPHGWMAGGAALFSAGWLSRNGDPQTVVTPPCGVDVSDPDPRVLKAKGVIICDIAEVGTHFMEISRHSGSSVGQHGRESVTVLPQSIFRFFGEVKKFCRQAHSQQPGSGSGSGSASFLPRDSEDSEDLEDPKQATWITSTGGHGLLTTDLQDLLGPLQDDGKPLLGSLWDFQVEMEVLPTIRERRRASLQSLAEDWTAAAAAASAVGATTRYWAIRAFVEMRNLYWYYKYFLAKPFMSRDAEDHLYHGVFGVRPSQLGMLKTVLERHVRRKCFASEAGHVGLGPVGTRPGDVVVVLLGSTVPMILRPMTFSGNCYEYVGEAYCHGFMHGRARARTGNVVEQWFHIR